ncbi:MAG TPA: YigZ family protein [Oceanospirillales bacterium]|nr:YigZ family protein [Oceanospirillales bacterium]
MLLKQLCTLHKTEEVIKKSTFITLVAPINSAEMAQNFIQKHSDLSATHNCWAYKIAQVYRFNDDGEPSGTAGKPMYNAIDGQGFDNTVALVIRHYGGIKLGTGGLMRAYGGGVSRCLQAADFEIIQETIDIVLTVPFSYIQNIHNLAKSFKAQIVSEDFNQDGAIICINILKADNLGFVEKSINLSKGRIFQIKH